MRCYVCSSRLEKVAISLYRCSSCRTLQREKPEEYYLEVIKCYNDEYYGSGYTSRYGKDIGSDVEVMRRFAVRRMDVIENIYLREGECEGCGSSMCYGCFVRNFAFSLRRKRVLDIGCGVGVFIEVAKSRGYSVKGIDINGSVLGLVSEYVRGDVEVADIKKFESDEKFDIVTMWYVLEHLPDPESVIRKVWGLLRYGGVFALSTPNGDGASARFVPKWYYSAVPEDHIFEFSPSSLSHLLRRNGFTVRRVVNGGFHPERVVRIGFFREVFGFFQRVIGLGDTFEVYSVKR